MGATSEITCTSCDIGTYSSVPGAPSSSTCLPCIAGSYGITTGLTTPNCSGLCDAGTSSFLTGATSISVCTTCPGGKWSLSGAPTCTNCSVGTFSDKIGATSSSECKMCGMGHFCPSGSTNFTLCPTGTWTNNDWAGNCTLCPNGTFNALEGSTSANACTKCSPGRYAPSAGTKSQCGKCPPSTIQPESGKGSCNECGRGQTSAPNRLTCSCPAGQIFVLSDFTTDLVCQVCPAGTFAEDRGTAVEGACTDCEPGNFCAAGISFACPSGTWSDLRKLTSSSNCTVCAAGTFSPSSGQVSKDSCIPCPSGYWSSEAAPQCTPCDRGKYNPSVASQNPDDCRNCSSGTFSNLTGQAVCLGQCSKGSYGITVRGYLEETSCKKCPSGSTISLGATSVAQCTEPVDCLNGLQYKPSSPPKKWMHESEGCVNLTCLSPLVDYDIIKSRPTSCKACGPGTKMDPNAKESCKTCRIGTVCPGFLTVELTSDSLAGDAGVGIKNSRCLAAAAAPTVLIPLTPGAFSETSLPSIATLGAGVGLIILIFLVVLCVICTVRPRARARDREPCNVRCAAFLSRWIKFADSFALFHRPIENEPQRYVPSLLGGFCNLAGYLTFAIIATFYCLRFGYDNSVATVSLNTVRADYNPFTPDVPWASAVSSIAPPLPSSSVQVRVLALSSLDCKSAVTSASVGLVAGAWSEESLTCSEKPVGFTLLTFSCSHCEFTPASAFHFTLPYTCQATYVELVSTDATGALQFVALNQNLTTATDLAFLKSVSWTVSVTPALYDNSITNKQARGYQLRSEASSSTLTSSFDKTNPQTWTLKPLEASVSFSIYLPLASAFSYTKLELRQTLVDLASTLVGLLGLLGAFRIFFMLAERMCAPAPPPDPAAAKRALNAPIVMKDLPAPKFRPEQSADVISSSPSPRSSLRNLSPDRGTSFVQENPLRSSGRALTPRIDDSGTPSGSRRHLGPRNFSHDDFDVPSESYVYDNPLRAHDQLPFAPFIGFDSSPQLSEPRRHLGPPVFSHDESNEPGNSLHGHDAALQGGRRHLAPAGFSHGGDME